MAVNYRVDGSVPITPAIPQVQHDWSPLYRDLENEKRREAAKAEEEAKVKAAKAKQASDEAQYNPDGVKDIDYNNTLEKEVKNVLKYSAESYLKGTTGTQEHNYNINRLKQQAELTKNKANAALASSTDAYNNVEKLPKYVDKGKLKTTIFDLSHPKKEDGTIDFSAINPDDIAATPTDYYHAINTHDMYADKIKDFGEKMQKKEIAFPVADKNDPNAMFNVMTSDMTQAKFFKPVLDKNGRVISYTPGVTDQAAKFMLEYDPDIMGEAKNQLNNYITKEATARAAKGDDRPFQQIYTDVERDTDGEKFLIDHVKLNMERFNAPSQTTERKTTKVANPGSGDENEVKLVETIDDNINAYDDKKGVIKGNIPVSYRLSGKKMDKPLKVNTTKITNIATDERMDKEIGDKTLHPTRIMQTPYRIVNGKTQYVMDDKEKLANDKDIKYQWTVEGKMKGKVQDPNVTDKQKLVDVEYDVLIPFDEVSDDLRAQYGIKKEDFDKSKVNFNFKPSAEQKKKVDPLGLK